MKRLSGVDAMMVYSETPNVHMHTLKMLVVDASDFDAAFDFDLFSRTIRGRIHLLEPLLYQLVEVPLGLHHPMWLDNAEIDWDYHLRRATAPAPGGRREFDQIVGQIASMPWTATARCGSCISSTAWPTTATSSSSRFITPSRTASPRRT